MPVIQHRENQKACQGVEPLNYDKALLVAQAYLDEG